MEDYQDRLRIATPEGVTVDLVLAGLGSRFTATLIDLSLKVVVAIALTIAIGLFGDTGLALLAIVYFLLYFGYDVAFEVLAGGRTPGKRWTGLRVLRDDGRPVDLVSSAIRNVVRLVDGLPLSYLPAMVSIVLTRRNQRIGDLVASTIVVREARRPGSVESVSRRTDPAPAPAITFGGFALPPGVGDASPLRSALDGDVLDVSAVGADDLAAVRGFLDRRVQLPDDVRQDLARRIAAALAPRVGGATAHLRDEELIEQVEAAKARGD